MSKAHSWAIVTSIALLVLLVVARSYIIQLQTETTTLTTQIKDLQDSLAQVSLELEQQTKETKRIEREKKELEKILVPPTSRGTSGITLKKLGLFTVTAYNENDPGGIGGGIYTAIGTRVKPYHTIAVDPRVIPYGSRLYIPYFRNDPNKGIFVAEDTGGAIKGLRLDVYLSTTEACVQFGRRKLEVYLIGR